MHQSLYKVCNRNLNDGKWSLSVYQTVNTLIKYIFAAKLIFKDDIIYEVIQCSKIDLQPFKNAWSVLKIIILDSQSVFKVQIHFIKN